MGNFEERFLSDNKKMGAYQTLLLLVLLTWKPQQSICKPHHHGGPHTTEHHGTEHHTTEHHGTDHHGTAEHHGGPHERRQLPCLTVVLLERSVPSSHPSVRCSS